MNILKFNRSLSILLIALLLGFPQISETIYTPSLPDLAHGLKVSDAWAEFTLSIYFIGFAVGVLIWGVIADWIGRRPAMLYGIALYALGSWGCYQSTHIASLLLWRFFQAVGASAGSVVTQTMIRDIYSGVKRNQVFSIVGGMLALSPALGPFLGGYIDELAGWRGNFAFLIGLGALLFIYSLLKLPETQSGEVKQRVPFREVALQLFTDKRIWGYAILIGASNGIIFSYYAEAPFLFIDLMKLTPTQYGLTGSVIAGASVLASLLSHRLNGRGCNPGQIILLGCYIMGLATLSLAYLAYEKIFLMPSNLHLGLILVLIAFLFFGIGLLIPNALSQALSAYQSAIGTAGALFGLLYYVLIAGFTFLMGAFHNGTALPMPLYFIALVALMYCSFYAFIWQEPAKNEVKI